MAKSILTPDKTTPMSEETRERLLIVADRLNGRVLFPKKIESGKRLVSQMKSLPDEY